MRLIHSVCLCLAVLSASVTVTDAQFSSSSSGTSGSSESSSSGSILGLPSLTSSSSSSGTSQQSSSSSTGQNNQQQSSSTGTSSNQGSSSSSSSSSSSNNNNYVCPNTGGYNSMGQAPQGGYSCQTSTHCGGSAQCSCNGACYNPSEYCCYEGHLGQAVDTICSCPGYQGSGYYAPTSQYSGQTIYFPSCDCTHVASECPYTSQQTPCPTYYSESCGCMVNIYGQQMSGSSSSSSSSSSGSTSGSSTSSQSNNAAVSPAAKVQVSVPVMLAALSAAAALAVAI